MLYCDQQNRLLRLFFSLIHCHVLDLIQTHNFKYIYLNDIDEFRFELI